MLRIRGLSKRYGNVVAVDDVSLSVAPGRLVGFVGPNGAGKSTVMRSIFGLVRPDAGTVTWNDDPAIDHIDRFGYMPEQRGLYPKMKIQEQVAYFGRLKQMSRREANDQAKELLSDLGLEDRLNDPLEKLSHGNQQRVQLAVSMINHPDLLILDEPFNGLDPVALITLQEVLEERARAGAAVLFSSHQLELVERLCDEVVMISDGLVRQSGTVADVRASAGVRYVAIEVDAAADPLDQTIGRLLDNTESKVVSASPTEAVIRVDASTEMARLLPALAGIGQVTRFDYDLPTLENVFTELVSSPASETDTTANGALQ